MVVGKLIHYQLLLCVCCVHYGTRNVTERVMESVVECPYVIYIAIPLCSKMISK